MADAGWADIYLALLVGGAFAIVWLGFKQEDKN